ncbi:MAG TPA: C4-dicarboxylate ABC transporter substrate-binding protein [Clostridiales bacterium]|nr:C4-dicarboxylate ABC transporter substrate-binding protein [Clostridiales bacterium]
MEEEMKKILSLILVLVMITTVLMTGCTKTETPPSQSETEEPKPSETSKEEYVLRVAHVLQQDHPTNTTLEDVFKKEVEEKSGGRIKVEVYPNGQLGSDRATIEALPLGTLEMCVPGGTILSGFVEDFMVFDLPFLFSSKEEAFAAFDGEVGDILNSKLEEIGIVNLGYGENGYRHVTNDKKPIRLPEDLKGVKIRTMENPIHMAAFQAFGANPTPISFNELFTALQQGTVDAQENPVAIIFTSKFSEVQKYLSLTGHVYTNCPYLISKTFLESLPEDLQQVIREAAKNTLTVQRKLLGEKEAETLEILKSEGMEINELTSEEKQAFVDAAKSVYDDFRAKYGSELLDKIEAGKK